MRNLFSTLLTLTLVTAVQAGTPVAGFADTAVATGLSAPTAIAFQTRTVLSPEVVTMRWPSGLNDAKWTTSW